jgi:uncharacterized RDD family membrane protein YckC
MTEPTLTDTADPKKSHLNQPQEKSRSICGFWRRLHALSIDGFVLLAFGLALGRIYGEQFARAGSLGRLFGFGIALGYFGFLNSSLGRGQTLGKRIMKIRVVDRGGETISPARAMVRAALLEVASS